MRNYLTNLNIVGAVSVYQEGDICRYCIDSLLKHCDKVVICQDNSDERTKNIINEYKNRFPDIIIIGETNLPPLKDGQLLRRRHKKLYGEIAQACLNLVREEYCKKPIDILIKLDSDEMFTNNIPGVLKSFVASVADTLFICPIGIIDDFHVIANKDLMSHARVYKYTPEITAIPYSQQDFYLPYRKSHNIIKLPWNYIHLSRFTKENREFRKKVGNGNIVTPNTKMWRINKPAYELTPEEYTEKIEPSNNFIRWKDYDGDINKIPLTII